MPQQQYSIPQVAQHLHVADWQARRAVDALVPRVSRLGCYRIVPASRVREVERELRRRGWLPDAAEVAG
jgi:hypothetical protein